MMQVKLEASFGRAEAVAHPLAELLACPPGTADLLNASAQSLEIPSGEIVFRQGDVCRGLFVVVSGLLLRKTERLSTRLTLGSVRPGDLVELAAALGDEHHTYTLMAQAQASLLMLPLGALQQAFKAYPPLRMQLLQELAREVSRAYNVCCATRMAGIRHRSNETSAS
jgi:CRP-like cAMP-binding protein